MPDYNKARRKAEEAKRRKEQRAASPEVVEELGKIYKWRKGDCLATITLRYRQPQKRYIELLELNKTVFSKNHFIMRPGDEIKIPDDWFPLPTMERDTTNFRGSFGYVR